MHDAKTHLSRLVERVEAGEEIVIARAGRPPNRNSAFRVGAGGERHSFNTLNGDILVRKAN